MKEGVYDNTLTRIVFICSILSGLGSLLVLLSYAIAATRTRPKAAQLIRNLAIADLAWTACAFAESGYWIADQPVPEGLCYITSPLVNFFRMASLLWTSAISFDVLMSLQKRKWLYDSEEQGWRTYRYTYYALIAILCLPGAIINSIIQLGYNSKGDRVPSFGCHPGHETGPENLVTTVTFLELVPIFVSFLFNCYIFCAVSNIMSKKAYPQSVRKRRRRVMYHYILICNICWVPTIFVYLIVAASYIFSIKTNSNTLEYLVIIARASSYMTGFLNFCVFGMQDPHLKRSFDLIVHSAAVFLGCSSANDDFQTYDLKSHDIVKSVMFEESTINKNADISKDKRHIYRKNRLSREDKEILYRDRPDLEPVPAVTSPPAKPSSPKGNRIAQSQSPTLDAAGQARSGSPKGQHNANGNGNGNVNSNLNDGDNNNINKSNSSNSSNDSNVKKSARFSESSSDIESGNRQSNNNNNNNNNDKRGGDSDSLSAVISSAISFVVHSDNNNNNNYNSNSNNDDDDDDYDNNNKTGSDINEPLLPRGENGKKIGNIDGKYIRKDKNKGSMGLSIAIPAEEYEYDNNYDDCDEESNSSGSKTSRKGRSSDNRAGDSSDSSSEDEKDDEDHELAHPVKPLFSPRSGSR